MARWLRLASSSVAVATLIVACGSRTGLDLPQNDCAEGFIDCQPAPDAQHDAPRDNTVPPADVLVDRDGPRDVFREGDGPLFEGGPLDVVTDCVQPAYCDPADPGFIYKCGVRIFQCNSLEQCELLGGTDAGDASDAGTASCINPCLDTLGQDTSNGCEFFSAVTDTDPTSAGACFAVFIVNQWKTGETARIEVDRGGALLPIDQFARIPVGKGTGITYAPYNSAQGLAKDQVAILFLSRDPNIPGGGTNPNQLAVCPDGVTPAFSGDAALHGTGIGTLFHIKTNVPVVAYQIFPYGGGRARITSATLLQPTNVWDTNFIAVNAQPPPSFSPNQGPTMLVMGRDNDTHVTINPVTPITPGGGLGPGPANVPTTYTVQRGQYLQFTQPVELTGSPLRSDKPVAVIGGSTIMQVPVGRVRADSAQQMLPPISAMGSEYVGVRFRARTFRTNEAVPWRLVGVVNGTQLTWEPSVPPGAPTLLNARQFVQFEAPGEFVVRSQDAAHPFHVATYMTGGKLSPFGGNEVAADGEGDAEFVNVVPPAQYLPRYTFFTDPTYPETNLVIVRVKDAALGVFPDVTLDCSGTLAGWQALGTAGIYEFTRVDLQTGDFQAVGGCNNGVHTIVGTFPGIEGGTSVPRFGVTVWGWGNTVTFRGSDPPDPSDQLNPKYTRWVSYAYPAGANFSPLNSVVVTP